MTSRSSEPKDRWFRLFEEARDGNDSSLDEFLEEIRPYVCRQVEAVANSAVDVSGAVQIALVGIWRHLTNVKISTPDALRRWLTKIAKNEGFTALRASTARKRDYRKEIRIDKDGYDRRFELPANDTTPSTRAMRNEEKSRREKIRLELRDDYQRVLRLRYDESREWKDVANRMDRTHEAVRRLYHRALKEWRRRAEDDSE